MNEYDELKAEIDDEDKAVFKKQIIKKIDQNLL